MKIVYCIVDSSQSGGTERVVCSKANYLSDILGYDVTIITTDQEKKTNFYSFSDRITFINLGINYYELKQYSFFRRINKQLKKRKNHRKKLTRVLMKIKADIVISTYNQEFTLIPSIKDGSQKIGEIHFSKKYNWIENKYKQRSLLFKIASILVEKRKYLFINKYEKFVVLTREDLKNWKNFPNVKHIYNPLSFYQATYSSLEAKRIISVGRLTLQKGFDKLIEIFSLVNKDFSNWHLDIFGAGEDERRLVQLIKKYKLESVVTINVPTKNIIKEYLASSICVMSSLYEGFGMALVEAMSCGLPCISFNCPCGPSEIIKDGSNGFLVENGNIVQFSEKIKILIVDKGIRKEMGKKAKENILCFSPNIIMKQWENLFRGLIEK